MVLTVEEKLARLERMEDWELYTPEQKTFLTCIANNIDPIEAMHQAKPELPLSGRGSTAFHAGRWMMHKTIEKALIVIQYERPEPVYTKREALQGVTYRLRKQGLEDETFIKLLTIYARMNGWDKPKSGKEEEEKEVSPLEAVLAAERQNASSI
jgi:hypothetical protein